MTSAYGPSSESWIVTIPYKHYNVPTVETYKPATDVEARWQGLIPTGALSSRLHLLEVRWLRTYGSMQDTSNWFAFVGLIFVSGSRLIGRTG